MAFEFFVGCNDNKKKSKEISVRPNLNKEMENRYLLTQLRHQRATGREDSLCDIANCVATSGIMVMMAEGFILDKKELMKKFGDKYITLSDVRRKFMEQWLEIMGVEPIDDDNHFNPEVEGERRCFPVDGKKLTGLRKVADDFSRGEKKGKFITAIKKTEITGGGGGSKSWIKMTKESAWSFLMDSNGKTNLRRLLNVRIPYGDTQHWIAVYYNPKDNCVMKLDPLEEKFKNFCDTKNEFIEKVQIVYKLD